MSDRLLPSKTSFVVQSLEPKDLESLRAALRPMHAEWEKLEGEHAIVLLRLAIPTSDVRAVWRELSDAIAKRRPEATVLPVLVDEQGDPHFPTGEFVVRFSEVKPDQDLESFGRAHDLRYCRRNSYVPQQAVFEIVHEHDRFLPDRLEDLRATPGIVAAWPSTLSGYRKEGD